MYLGFFAIAVVLMFCCGSATQNYLELKPELGMYQDAALAFPLTETWHIAYRNYEDDPAFGTSKCLRFAQVQPEKDGAYPVVALYGADNQSANAVITFEANEGYTTKNRIMFLPDSQDQPLPLYLSFLDPEKCGVMRNVYVNEDACAVVVPESKLEEDTTCCDFVYALLCGATKYQIHDDSCTKQG
ncbi:uncharacterized protein LOC115322780 [Ixodes scapularis]|uniref:uncharacterized protein LOC115322780 n=1 Tax=Ixodes scapularis TaxID=6945 RepID=UPI001A9F7827|nr:uncharacterized protein LOC115322780 [Ixodes scapularis]